MNKHTPYSLGSFYVETMVALLMVGIIATSFLPILPSLLKKTKSINQYSYLESIASYCGSYIFRWVNFSSQSKVIPFEFFEENDPLEFTGETRVNKLIWATPPELLGSYISDHYKVTILFKDTINRINSAGITITVWYDKNLNLTLDPEEKHITFSTIISEKETP